MSPEDRAEAMVKTDGSMALTAGEMEIPRVCPNIQDERGRQGWWNIDTIQDDDGFIDYFTVKGSDFRAQVNLGGHVVPPGSYPVRALYHDGHMVAMLLEFLSDSEWEELGS
jgi:hypothetical protein